jgi:hypothetical protein
VSVPRITVAAAEGTQGSRLLASSLSTRQKSILATLPDQGSTAWLPKRGVSMADLRAIGQHTGDEFSMYTSGGRRFIIRGYGNEVRVAPDVADALRTGQFGRWSGHTHPPGYSMNPTLTDRMNIPVGQSGSAIWGDGPIRRFSRMPAEDGSIGAINVEEMIRRFNAQ